jgi:hypothetical protein
MKQTKGRWRPLIWTQWVRSLRALGMVDGAKLEFIDQARPLLDLMIKQGRVRATPNPKGLRRHTYEVWEPST